MHHRTTEKDVQVKKYLIFLFFVSLRLAIAQPTRVTDLSAVATNGGVVLTWTAPTTLAAALTNLDVRYDTSPINKLNWSSKPQLIWLTDPGMSGTIQNAVVTGLTPKSNYYFALKTQDSTGLWSTISIVVLVVAGGSTYSAGLAWDPSTAESATNYDVYVGSTSGTYDISTNRVGNVTSFTVSNLTWGVAYYISVTKIDNLGFESDFSNEVLCQKP